MNREDVLQLLRTRYTTKHYDASRPVSDEDLAVLLEALRLSPTSVNGQYTKFFVAKTPEARARLMPAVMDFNQERVKNASHLIVFAVPKTPTEEHLRAVLEQETADGRFPADMPEAVRDAGRRRFTDRNNGTPEAFRAWTTAQAYIALGFLLYTAALIGVDTTAIEGAEFDEADRILGFDEMNMRTVMMVALGHRDPNDSNARRPKSRLPMSAVVEEITG